MLGTSSLVRAMVGNMSCEGGLGLGFWRLCPVCGVIPFRVTKSAHVPFRLSLFFFCFRALTLGYFLQGFMVDFGIGVVSSLAFFFIFSLTPSQGLFQQLLEGVCVLLVAADKLVTAVSHSSAHLQSS